MGWVVAVLVALVTGNAQVIILTIDAGDKVTVCKLYMDVSMAMRYKGGDLPLTQLLQVRDGSRSSSSGSSSSLFSSVNAPGMSG